MGENKFDVKSLVLGLIIGAVLVGGYYMMTSATNKNAPLQESDYQAKSAPCGIPGYPDCWKNQGGDSCGFLCENACDTPYCITP